MNRDAEYIEILKGKLTEKRFIHSLNVAESAKELAKLYGYNEEIAYTAGLVHDCCKDTPAGLQLSYMLENGAELTEIEISSAKLYHAMCGSIYVKKEFEIENEDIINAVRYHTTGRKDMSLLEKIVFIADFISAERDYDGVEIMREKAIRSLDEAIVEGLGFTIKDLIDRGERFVHPDTIDAYNDAMMNILKQKQERN
ncbi:MAG: HD domain-containing protein [Ruminococcaceae bacterium]|nr:HD domain-containing protein [Oscillospiraceae bacterium]